MRPRWSGSGEQPGCAAAHRAARGQAPDEDRCAAVPVATVIGSAAAAGAAPCRRRGGSGVIGEDHLWVVGRAIDALPSFVSVTDRDDVERSLVAEASKNDAEIVRAVGRRIDEIFNPDGDYDEADGARRRGLLLGEQGRDGMSRLSGYIDPETRAYLEAVTAAVRPGRHLPDGTIAKTRDERSVPRKQEVPPAPRSQTGVEGSDRLRRAGQPSGACGDGDHAHHAGRHQPRPPPRRTPARQHRPTRQRREVNAPKGFGFVAGPSRLDEHAGSGGSDRQGPCLPRRTMRRLERFLRSGTRSRYLATRRGIAQQSQ